MEDEYFIGLALAEAEKAAALAEVPVGAVIVKDDQVIASGYNLKESGKDTTLHAEMIALRAASKALGGWRLSDCTLYVTLEPCPMCAGAMMLARIDRLVFGAFDPKAGCAGSVLDIPATAAFNHQMEVVGGVRAAECGEILSGFFRARRQKTAESGQLDA